MGTTSGKIAILNALEEACCIYQRGLASCQEAYRYLTEERSIKNDTIKQFRLGYALCTKFSDRNLVTKALMKKHALDSLIDSGLTFIGRPDILDYGCENSKMLYYLDRFRDHCIIIPVFNLENEVIAFEARNLHRDAYLKYINHPETAVFSKRQVLYGLNFAMEAINERGSVFVFEGCFDVILAHQYKVENSVALMGTGLHQDHFHSLKGLLPDVQIMIC